MSMLSSWTTVAIYNSDIDIDFVQINTRQLTKASMTSIELVMAGNNHGYLSRDECETITQFIVKFVKDHLSFNLYLKLVPQ